MGVSPQVSAYFRELGRKATGDKKRRSPEYYRELSQRGVEARKAKRAATARVAEEKKNVP